MSLNRYANASDLFDVVCAESPVLTVVQIQLHTYFHRNENYAPALKWVKQYVGHRAARGGGSRPPSGGGVDGLMYSSYRVIDRDVSGKSMTD